MAETAAERDAERNDCPAFVSLHVVWCGKEGWKTKVRNLQGEATFQGRLTYCSLCTKDLAVVDTRAIPLDEEWSR